MVNVNGICGGSIISSRTIVTAAHCFARNPITEVIVADHNRAVRDAGEFSVKVCEVRKHPRYPRPYGPNEAHEDYDYGLLFLCEDLTWSRVVSPICLPDINFDNEGREAILVGWGYNNTYSGPQPNVLQTTTLITLSNDECIKTSSYNVISSRQICAVNPHTSACFGDSGGPLAVKDPGYQPYTLVGIACMVIDDYCSTNATGIPGVFTRVTEMLEWTTNSMKGTTCDKENIPEGRLILQLAYSFLNLTYFAFYCIFIMPLIFI